MPGLTPLPLGCPQDHTVNYVPETRFPPLATQRMWDRVQEVWCTILSMSVPAGGSPQVLWGKVNRVGGQSAPTCSLGSAPPLVSNDLPSANCEWGAQHTPPQAALASYSPGPSPVSQVLCASTGSFLCGHPGAQAPSSQRLQPP